MKFFYRWLNRKLQETNKRDRYSDELVAVDGYTRDEPALYSRHDQRKYIQFKLFPAEGGTIVETISVSNRNNNHSHSNSVSSNRDSERVSLYIIRDDCDSFADELSHIITHERLNQ